MEICDCKETKTDPTCTPTFTKLQNCLEKITIESDEENKEANMFSYISTQSVFTLEVVWVGDYGY